MRTTPHRLNGTVVQAPARELDLEVVPELGRLLAAAHRPGATVLLDLQRVTFLDSSALSVILSTDRLLQSSGGRLRLVHAGEQVRRVLRIVGLGGLELPTEAPRRLRRSCLVRHLRH